MPLQEFHPAGIRKRIEIVEYRWNGNTPRNTRYSPRVETVDYAASPWLVAFGSLTHDLMMSASPAVWGFRAEVSDGLYPSPKGEDSYGLSLVLRDGFGGFLGRAPYRAARISRVVTSRVPRCRSFDERTIAPGALQGEAEVKKRSPTKPGEPPADQRISQAGRGPTQGARKRQFPI